MESNLSLRQPVLSQRPWVLFLLFALSSAVLSYAPVSLTVKFEFGIFGILLPFAWALLEIHGQAPGEGPLFDQEILPLFSPWIFLLVVLVALELRFADLTSYPVWPNTDEGLVARFGLDLSHQWRWRFFYTFGQVPPGYEWLLSLMIPRARESLAGIWFLSALVSSLAFLLSYLAFRPFFSRAMAALGFMLWGLSFWGFFPGRFSHPGILLSLWECLALASLGFYLKATTPRARLFRAAWLGLATGLGTFTFTPWPVFALWVGAVVTLETFKLKKPRGPWVLFLAVFLFCQIPFLAAIVTEGFGHHIFAVSSVRGYMPAPRQVMAFLSYLAAPFWGVFEDQPAYAPVWGGMLNPILAAAFFIGALESWRHRLHAKVQWAWAGGLLCLLPGLLSMNVEMYRVILVLPFILLGAGWGLLRLLKDFPFPKRNLILLGFMVCSLGLDTVHLATPHFYPLDSPKGPLLGTPPGKPLNAYRAWQILKVESQKGPGLFFNDFTSIPYDQTLDCGVYAFNALENPKIPFGEARWASFWVNACYEPFLRKTFPQGKWIWLDGDVKAADGGEMLAVIPIDDSNRARFFRWVQAYSAFRELDWGWLELADFQKGESLLSDFSKGKTLLEGDPFLLSLYWEKTSDLLYRDKAFPRDMEALGQALREGYPSAHLFYKRGSIELRKNLFPQAEEDLSRALKAPGNRTLAAQALEMAKQLEKEGGLPPSSP